MNTEPVLNSGRSEGELYIMLNIELQKFGETTRFVEDSRNAAAWPWPTNQTTTPEILRSPSDGCHAAHEAASFMPFIEFQLWFWCIGKIKKPEPQLKNTGAIYAVTIPGGRQRQNGRTRESLCGANARQRQAAARSRNTLESILLRVLRVQVLLLLLYDIRSKCIIHTGYVNTLYQTGKYLSLWKYKACLLYTSPSPRD